MDSSLINLNILRVVLHMGEVGREGRGLREISASTQCALVVDVVNKWL